jgi:hypothetical protein
VINFAVFQKPVWLVSHTPLMATLVTKLSFVTRVAITEHLVMSKWQLPISNYQLPDSHCKVISGQFLSYSPAPNFNQPTIWRKAS